MKHVSTAIATLLLGLAATSGTLAATEREKPREAAWTEVYQSSPADYDIVIPEIPDDIPEEVMKRYKINRETIERMRPRPPVTGTLRSRFAVSVGGRAVRLRFSNEESDSPLTIQSASVAIADGEGFDAQPGSVRELTFGGSPSIVIPAGAPALSDPVQLRIPSQGDLIVSIHVPDSITLKPFGGAGMMGAEGDQTRSERLEGGSLAVGRPIVTGASALADGRPSVIVAFGDSITDGNRMNPGELHGWPEQLNRRLAQRGGRITYSVVNAGIGGNRVLENGWGISALARFDRDVARIAIVSHVIVLEGINDIGNSGRTSFGDNPVVTANDLIAGYRQIIERAHARGIKVVMGTLLPFEGAVYFSSEKELVRLAVNEWIRSSGEADSVIDFDRITRDPAQPSKLAPLYDSGDHLHPGELGYRAMGDAINLGIFE